jgi:hypothetical protein
MPNSSLRRAQNDKHSAFAVDRQKSIQSRYAVSTMGTANYRQKLIVTSDKTDL